MTNLVGPSRFLLQGGQIITVITVLPAIERLGRYPEISTGLAGVAKTLIMIEPLPLLRGILGYGPLANQGSDKLRAGDDVPVDPGRMWIYGDTYLTLRCHQCI
jgi:hypothetical protein